MSSRFPLDIMSSKSWTVVVLGDINQSPRMMNHVNMLKQIGKVQVVSYGKMKDVTTHSLPTFEIHGFYMFWAGIKFLLLNVYLFYYLTRYPTRNILIQNPPSLPVLFVLWILKSFTSKFIVLDWHNLGYTILKTKTDGAIVEIYKKLENSLSFIANVNLTVSKEMQTFLSHSWEIRNLHVVYDYPPELFRPLSSDEILSFWNSLSNYRECSVLDNIQIRNVFKIVTGTSYTPDEDIFLLLDALNMLDNYLEKSPGTKVIAFITGRGPLRNQVEMRIQSLKMSRVEVCCVWLKYSDYPRLLASCDVGVSLHSSSSGLDLPMKIWDMFGCGLPVFALEYRALPELVKKSYGYTFQDSNSLFQLFVSHLENTIEIKRCKETVQRDFVNKKWQSEWNEKVLPLIEANSL
eukprot:NODE_20_length_44879_cov_0.624654.p13 type:complete len:405 gc:universal NODE_20_length_44879_cov_0.624654:17188-15974(-)